jgi:hypothetical protein
MNGFVLPSMEGLESRRLMSATFATGGLCLIPPRSHPPTPAPTPTPTPVPTAGRHHHHRTRAAAPSPSPVGDWAGNSIDASLEVRVSQAGNGDLFAKVAFTGATSFQGSAQLTYSSTTGQFTMWVVSPRLVVKFSGTLVTPNRDVPEFHGSLETYSRKGAFKGQFVLQKTQFPPAGSL